VALYHGDFLAGLHVKDPGFEDWLTTERDRLRQVVVAALTRLLARQRDAAATEPAIETARRLVAIDPLQESVHRTLMRLYLEQGQRASALRQYHACAGVLRRELATEPEAATRALYREIVQQSATSTTGAAAAHAPPAPLIGRQRELAALAEQLTLASPGRGRVVAMLGEAGIGKTRLTEALGVHAAGHDCRVL